MDRIGQKSGRIISLAIALVVVFILLSLLNLADPLSYGLRPAISWLLALTGLPVQNFPEYFTVGKLMVPWTRDCAGINLLLLLWALLAWVNWDKYTTPMFWIRMALAIPVTMIANLGRIMTIVAYRWFAYPVTETTAVHYLIGFVWILPFLKPLVSIRGESGDRHGFLDILYLMGVLALAATHVGSPGGNLVLLATLVMLVELKSFPRGEILPLWIGLSWLAGGVLIGISGMESLWIPFLLCCPFLFDGKRWKSVGSYGSLLATIPVLAMHAWIGWILVLFVMFKIWEMIKKRELHAGSAVPRPSHLSPAILSVPIGLVMPFLMPMFNWRPTIEWNPSPSQIVQRMDPLSYQLKAIAQPPGLQVYGYLPMGDGRHHSLEVCMRYRGVSVKQAAGNVMTDGDNWMKQYFFQDGVLISDYRSYLLRTFAPFSDAGIHLIAVAPVDLMDEASFEQTADTTVARLISK